MPARLLDEPADDLLAETLALLVGMDGDVGDVRAVEAVRERSSAKVVAVTGSTAKTSTKDILGALCSPHAGYITGETLTIDGGHWLEQESYMPALKPRA